MTPDEIPSEAIKGFIDELHPHLDAVVRKYCDEAYSVIMENAQYYLSDNAEFNIKSKFDAQQRGYMDAVHALAAVESSLTLREAQANAYAFRKGYWSAEYAAKAHAAEELAAAKP